MIKLAKIALVSSLIYSGGARNALKPRVRIKNAAATITVGKKSVTRKTDSRGLFEVPNKTGDFTLKIAKKGYMTLTSHVKKDMLAGYTDEYTMGYYSLVPVRKDHKKGKITGKVVDAHDGTGANVTVILYKGTNTVSKAYKKTKAKKGVYSFKNLKAGYYTLGVSGKKYITTTDGDSVAVGLTADTTLNQQLVAVPHF